MLRNRRDNSSMSETETLDAAARLVWRERYRSHLDLPTAIKTVARRVGIAPGSLENLVRGRAKKVTLSVAEAIRAAVVSDLSAEIERLQHELDIARQSGVHPVEAGKVEALLAEAKALLRL